MNSIILGFLFGLISFGNLFSQSPVKWTFESKDLGDKIEVTATATMKAEWFIYSQLTDDNGPIPTSFTVGDQTVQFEEKSTAIKGFDELFEVEVIKFKEVAVFSKSFDKVSGNVLKGYVTFMSCDGEKCLPPADVDFVVKM